jgi:hypothetical protein
MGKGTMISVTDKQSSALAETEFTWQSMVESWGGYNKTM